LNEQVFVIRLADGQYVGPLSNPKLLERVPTMDGALFFPTRFLALGKCRELGPALHQASILPYSLPMARKSPATAPEAPETTGTMSERAGEPQEGGSGQL